MNTSAITKEPRYWAWEFFIALVTILGTLVLSIGIPFTIQRSTGWATLAVGAGEGVVAIGLFAGARVNALRAVAAGAFLGGAVSFVLGLNLVY